MIEAIKQSDIIIIDTETNAEDIRDGRGYGTGISIACSPNNSDVIFAEYYPYRHVTLDGRSYGENLSGKIEIDLKVALKNILDISFFIMLSLIYVVLALWILITKGIFYCTLLMAHLINENYPYSKSLNACVAAYVDKNEAKKKRNLKKQ